jgi:hypothetical protein
LPLGQGFVAGSDNEVIVAFAGSREAVDWGFNLAHQLIPGYGGHVHKGFAFLAEQVADVVDAAVSHFHDGRQTVHLTGHSRGGALAALTAWRLRAAGMTSHSVMTFGAPRFADKNFARTYLPSHFCVEDAGDPVPCLPLGSGYAVIGTRLELLRDGTVYQLDGSWMDQLVLLSQLVAAPGKEGVHPRHSAKHYARMLGWP